MEKIRNIEIKKDTIFVSIASYRDSECQKTLKSLFDNAKNKNNCFVGICEQNNFNIDDDCLINNEWKCNISIIRIPYFEAKGPTYARYLCSSLWNGEEYYLQIDSHSTFIKDWDEKLINMIKEIKNRKLSLKPVLSHYPVDVKKINEKTNTIPHIHSAEYNKNGIIVLSAAIYTDNNNDFKLSYFMSAGMFFCESKFLNEIPFDPTLDDLFEGEEILTSIRFYTNGWDVFTPKENILFHEYYREDKPKYFIDNTKTFNPSKAQIKVKNLLDVNFNDPEEKYGLGKIRTLNDFYSNAKILSNIEKFANKIKNNIINISLIFFMILFLIVIIIICLSIK
jgi:[Skp1-protein]-hydroxyproline N-acetylglucosaminyltransferase